MEIFQFFMETNFFGMNFVFSSDLFFTHLLCFSHLQFLHKSLFMLLFALKKLR